MSTQDAYAVWEEKTLERGAQRGIERGLAVLRAVMIRFYEWRFGPMPAAARARIEATSDLDLLTQWSELIETAPRSEVDRALADA